MANEDRLAALRGRIQKTSSADVSQVKQKSKARSDRNRHTLYLDNTIVEQVDMAYKAVAHSLYPVQINKSDFLEACLRYALAHGDEIKAMLVSDR
jgi:hypothetical protein